MKKARIRHVGCVIPGCGLPHEARRFCRVHYRPAAKAFKAGTGSWEWLAEHPEKIEDAGSAGGGNGNRPEPAAKPDKIQNPVPVSISLLKLGSIFMLDGKVGKLKHINCCGATVELRSGSADRFGREARSTITISTDSIVLAPYATARNERQAIPITPPELLIGDARRLYEAMAKMFPTAYGRRNGNGKK